MNAWGGRGNDMCTLTEKAMLQKWDRVLQSGVEYTVSKRVICDFASIINVNLMQEQICSSQNEPTVAVLHSIQASIICFLLFKDTLYKQIKKQDFSDIYILTCTFLFLL